MVQAYTLLNCADNTGAKQLMCIRVLGGSRRRYARVGDVIVASVKEANPNSQVKKGGCCTSCRSACNQGTSQTRWFLYQIR